MGKLSSALLVSFVVAANAGFYPDGHFNHVRRLNSRNFETEIRKEVDAGKTVFVRWIHSTN